MFLIQTYDVTDARFYDTSSSTNLSKYTATGSMTYDSSNQAYLLNNGSTNYKWKSATLSNVNFPNNCTVKSKIKLISSTNCQIAIGLLNTNQLHGVITLAGGAVYSMSARESDTSMNDVHDSTVTLSSSTLLINTWYDVVLEYTTGQLVFKLYNGDTLVNTATLSSSALDISNNQFIIEHGLYGNSQILVKDIMIL